MERSNKITLKQYKKNVTHWLAERFDWELKTAYHFVTSCEEFIKKQWDNNITPAVTAKIINREHEEILATVRNHAE